MAGPRTWALVADGTRARVLSGFERAGAREGTEQSAPVILTTREDAMHLGELMADKAGRSFASDGSGRRSAMEPGSDPVRHGLHAFAREVLEALERRHRAGEFERLAVLASPRMLGILRDEMPDALRGAVVLERPANLGWVSDREVRDIVGDLLRRRRREA